MPLATGECKACSAVRLASLQSGEWRTYLMGSWERIKSSQCPLCVIIKLACYESTRFGGPPVLRDDGEIQLIQTPLYANGVGVIAIKHQGREISTLLYDIQNSSPEMYYDRSYQVPAVLDVRRISAVLSDCDSTHECRGFGFHDEIDMALPGLSFIRLVDVQQQCLVEMKTLVQYIALSNVWGSTPTVRLSTFNKATLFIPGAIDKAKRLLPRTITDAMVLAEKLNVRFLWVDTLCLVQNDSEDVTMGINVMDRIYERAWLTIVAAYGHDANAGLPGVREGTREASELKTYEIKRGAFIVPHTNLDVLIRHSAYSSRGWT